MAHLSAFQAFGIPFKIGAKIVMVRKSSPEILVEVIPKYKISKAILSLSNINVLSNWPQNCDLSSLRRVLTGGTKIVPSSVSKFIDRYKPDEFFHGYGMTESGGVVCEVDLCHAQEMGINLDCVGKVLPGVQLKVMEIDSGLLMGPNQSGELCIQTPFRFLKYHNDPERTKATLDEENWIHSGDVGYYDDNGYVYIVDRIKDMIDQNGFHFSPADIEEVLLQHSDVINVCAVGIPEAAGGHLAHAFVIKKEGSQVAEDELKLFVNERVSKFKQIKGSVHFVSEFPMTAFGKVKRRELRELYEKR